jgi:hypothetical protein
MAMSPSLPIHLGSEAQRKISLFQAMPDPKKDSEAVGERRVKCTSLVSPILFIIVILIYLFM